MKKNDTVIGKCIDYTHEGLGVVREENFVFFIKDILIGEEIEFVITKLNKNYGYGKCTKIISASNERVVPFCDYYKNCGGCQIQHMSINEQLLFKTNLVKNNMTKIGGIDTEVFSTIENTRTEGYRNKAQFPISIKGNNIYMGFYRAHSNEIIDMKCCGIQSDMINQIMGYLRTQMKVYKFNDVFRHVLIKHAFSTEEIMVVFITKQKEISGLDQLVSDLAIRFTSVKSVIQNVNGRKDNVILGEEEILLYGNRTIVDELNGFKFLISSKSFYQVNPLQTEVLYEKALEYACINKDDIVIDLYCGVGTISLFLAKQAKKVIGIEIIPAAIEDARENAILNKIDNVEFVCSDAATYANYLVEQNSHPNVVVVDPPRKGCDESTLNSIKEMNPERIIYISCNPSTLARDLKILDAYGYCANKIQPVDMFSHSYHIESVVRLSRTK